MIVECFFLTCCLIIQLADSVHLHLLPGLHCLCSDQLQMSSKVLGTKIGDELHDIADLLSVLHASLDKVSSKQADVVSLMEQLQASNSQR